LNLDQGATETAPESQLKLLQARTKNCANLHQKQHQEETLHQVAAEAAPKLT
jgi:hypothetical protein